MISSGKRGGHAISRRKFLEGTTAAGVLALASRPQERAGEFHSASIVVNHACPFVNPRMEDSYIEKLRAGGITLSMSTVAHNHSFRGAIDQITSLCRLS